MMISLKTKIWTILKSRFIKMKYLDWQMERVDICLKCPYNTLNLKAVSLKLKITKFFSDLYSFLTFNREEKWGSCSQCGCPIYQKVKEVKYEHTCPLDFWPEIKETGWKSIYIPNKK